MRNGNPAKLTSYSPFSAMILAVVTLLALGKGAAALTADDVLNKMPRERGTSYLDGNVEGLATARWIKDKPDGTGVNCIYDWYFQQPKNPVVDRIYALFGKYPDQQAGALMFVLLKEECGE